MERIGLGRLARRARRKGKQLGAQRGGGRRRVPRNNLIKTPKNNNIIEKLESKEVRDTRGTRETTPRVATKYCISPPPPWGMPGQSPGAAGTRKTSEESRYPSVLALLQSLGTGWAHAVGCAGQRTGCSAANPPRERTPPPITERA